MFSFMKTLFLIFTLIILSSFLSATILNVPGSFPTIQVGIDATVDTDTVLVQPGTYFENIDFNGKNITVASLFHTTQDTSYISSTIIDGNSNTSVVRFHSGEDSTAVLSGFTITNGDTSAGGGIWCTYGSPLLINLIITGNSATWGGGVSCTYLVSTPRFENVIIVGNSALNIGGGIHCANNSYPSLENVTISENTAVNYGGGVYISNADINYHNVTISGNIANSHGGGMYLTSAVTYLQNVTLSDNEASAGGGIYCYGSSPILQNISISGNIGNYHGGGIYLWGSNPILDNVTIENNSVGSDYGDDGGGIYCMLSNPILQNVTISGNSAGSNYGNGGGIYGYSNSNLSLVNCIMWNDSPDEININSGSATVTYSDIQDGWEGTGNIDSDPEFIDPANSNYNLSETSPCIDVGDPASSLDPDGTIADMGANYFHQSMNCEFTADVVFGVVPLEVTFTDLSQGFIEEWEWDFDNDGTLDSYEQNPTYIYNDIGVYSVSLTVSNSILSDDLTIIDYITVNEVSGSGEITIPNITKLYQNHPNPFNPITNIHFDIKENETGALSIFNLKGQIVESHSFNSGRHSYLWNAQDCSSGVYFYKLQTETMIETRKMLLLK